MIRGTDARAGVAATAAAIALVFLARSALAQSPLEKGFLDPPPETKPWVYWYWANDRISRDGITRDLESMAKAGIGEALIGNVFLVGVERGPVKALTEEWWGLVEHAIREGGRVGVDLGIFNCPGWSQAGGPWVKPEQSMRHLVTVEQRATGPAKFEGAVPTPKPWQDVALFAFPAPKGDSSSKKFPPITRASPAATVELDLAEPMTARTLTIGGGCFKASFTLFAVDEAGNAKKVRDFDLDRSQACSVAHVGPSKRGPTTFSLPPATSKRFRLQARFEMFASELEVELSEAARVDRYVEKKLGVMHQDPMPRWDAYLWPQQPEPEAQDLVVAPERIVNLAGAMDENGVVRWDVPEGDWVIVRAGMTPTGAKNAPATDEACGLEVDKMSRAAVQAHFDAYVGKLVARMPAADRKALKHVVADSWEAGPQNWTDGFAGQFIERYGYDPLPWLPVMTGRIVGTAERSDRFLWDLRRLVADCIASDYAGGLREACNRHGLKLWLQNYGHWGFPADFLQYGGRPDAVSGEFWAGLPYGAIEMRAASSAAHGYGLPVVSAEAFTGGRPFQETPWSLKRLGDRALANGINHFALHLFFHQPSEDRPGVNSWFGTEFNRHNTWFAQAGPWIDYWRSAQFLLRQGRHVADVAYFTGEDAPKMTGVQDPPLPPGLDFDWVGAETIERMTVVDGQLTVPGGSSWRVLVLPPSKTMRPALLRKIRDLVEQGGALMGEPPERSPSLEGWPECDAQVKALAAELWAGADGKTATHARFGKGDVFRGVKISPTLEQLGLLPDVSDLRRETVAYWDEDLDVLWTHRATAEGDVYFISNQADEPRSIAPWFRRATGLPEIWTPDRRTILKTAAFEPSRPGRRVALDLDAGGSAFVIFRNGAADVPAVTEVTRGNRVVLSAESRPHPLDSKQGTLNCDDFAMMFWVLPDADITIPVEADAGVVTPAARNDAIFPFNAGLVYRGPKHAFAGVSVGRNGVVVYEHSTAYFAPILVWAGSITDWTHVAVVYVENRPTLYLDGKPVHQGLKSTAFRVMASPDASDPALQKLLREARVETGAPFVGQLGAIQRFEQRLDAPEVAAFARLPMVPGAARPLVVLERAADGGVEAVVAAGGNYRGKLADGRVLDLPAAALPEPRLLDGPWEVHFPAGMDAPERLELDRLIPLTDHTNEAVRCFSGTAAYGTSFQLSATWLAEDRRVLLDLGKVESIAEVFVNARPVGTLWKPPYVLDITAALQPRVNALTVRVTNTWWNRLVGSRKFPDGFPGAGPLQFKPKLAFADENRLTGDLVPSGLMGPVRLHPTQRLKIPFR